MLTLNPFSGPSEVYSGFDDESIASGFTDMTAVHKVSPAKPAAPVKEAAAAAAKAPPAAEEAAAVEAPSPPAPATDNGAENPETAEAAPAGDAAAAEEQVAVGEPEKPKVCIMKESAFSSRNSDLIFTIQLHRRRIPRQRPLENLRRKRRRSRKASSPWTKQ